MDPTVPPGSDAKAIHSIAADNGAGPAVIWHRAGKGGWLSPFILRTVAAYAVRSLAGSRGRAWDRRRGSARNSSG